ARRQPAQEARQWASGASHPHAPGHRLPGVGGVRMKPLSLRTSLLLWMLLLTSFLLLAFSLALYSAVRQSLLAGVDAALRARLEATADECEWENGAVRLELPDVPVPATVGAAREVWRWPEPLLVHHDSVAIDLPIETGVPVDDPAARRFRASTAT